MISLRVSDLLLRLLGGIFAVAIGAATALLEAVASPLPWFAAPLAAIVVNAFLYWFTRETIGTSWAWSVAAVPWFIVMIAAVSPTGEGDQLANSMTGLLTFAAGALTFFALIAFRPLPRRARPHSRMSAPAQPPVAVREDQTL